MNDLPLEATGDGLPRLDPMPDTRKNRGPGPQDPTWFSVDAQVSLRAA